MKALRVAVRVTAGGVVMAAAAGLILASRGLTVSGRGDGARADRPAATMGTGGGRAAAPSAGARSAADARALVLKEAATTRELVAGARVSAPRQAPVHMSSLDGTALTLASGGTLSVVDVGQVRRFALLRGVLHARVKKLGEGERFIIETADAAVEVRGTAFRVEAGVRDAGCPASSRGRRGAADHGGSHHITTRVTVEEGVVSVRGDGHTERLYPGESWPAPCASAPGKRAAHADRAAAAAKAAAERRSSARELEPATAAPPAPALAPPSTLSEQNDLFSAAVAARKRGDSARALELFERLLAEHPQSSLVEGALAARMRLLAASRSERAPAAAATYLSRFPDGFARFEAAALLRGAEHR